MNIIELASQAWPWYLSGALIALVMYWLLWAGGEFGVSSNLRTLCSIGGAGKISNFFNFDWKAQLWNLAFIAGSMVGGFIAHHYLQNPDAVQISAQTMASLQSNHVIMGDEILPASIFSWESLFSLRGFTIMVVGGFLVGFGARYAGGCTSGHAISGLSNLQLPSLVAVIGFFAGGLLMTWIILPYILNL